jgi:phage N-6-adenine-methyltransferase
VTPPEFLTALYQNFLIDGFALDAAASVENAIAPIFYTEETNGLIQPWLNMTWCNPPYSNIAPWVEKAWTESLLGATSFVLVPASAGANWWKAWVHDKAHVIFLNGRITFVGQEDPYPKDCALLIYTPLARGGYEIWSWQ